MRRYTQRHQLSSHAEQTIDILGILGGILGGWIFGLLGIWHGGDKIGSIIVAFIGAVILVAITRVLKRA